MGLEIARFLSLFFVALVLAPAMAHLLELPNKIGLSREDYLVVQQIYNGWQRLGIVIYGALLSTLVLTIMVRHQPMVFGLTLAAFLCLLTAHAFSGFIRFPRTRKPCTGRYCRKTGWRCANSGSIRMRPRQY